MLQRGNQTHSKTSLRWTVLLPPMPQGIVKTCDDVSLLIREKVYVSQRRWIDGESEEQPRKVGKSGSGAREAIGVERHLALVCLVQ